MIEIKVHTILDLKAIMGSGEVSFQLPDGSTLEELIRRIADNFGEEMALRLYEAGSRKPLSHLRFMINGRDIAFLDGFKTRLKHGDDVLIVPPVAGG